MNDESLVKNYDMTTMSLYLRLGRKTKVAAWNLLPIIALTGSLRLGKFRIRRLSLARRGHSWCKKRLPPIGERGLGHVAAVAAEDWSSPGDPLIPGADRLDARTPSGETR